MVNKISLYIDYLKKVSVRFAALNALGVIDERCRRFLGTPYHRWIYKTKDDIFQVFLRHGFSDLIGKWAHSEETGVPFEKPEEAPIWMLWIQGPDKMPVFVTDMIKVVRMNCGRHPLNVLDVDAAVDRVPRLGKYVELYREGKIGPAHLSDIVRINLLRDYGGMWLDASVLLTSGVNDEYFKMPFWTAKGLDPDFPLEPKCVDITKFETYFLCSWKNSLLFMFAADFLDAYFNRYDTVLDYLLINHIFKIARENIAVIAEEYSVLPDNNTKCELLSSAMDSLRLGGISENALGLMDGDTQIFKLSTRAEHAGPVLGDAEHSFAYEVYMNWKNGR